MMTPVDVNEPSVNTAEKKTSGIKALNGIIISLLVLLFCNTTYLFYQFAQKVYKSDFPVHIATAKKGKGYSLMEVLFYRVNMLSDSPVVIPLLMSVIILLTVFATFWAIKQIQKVDGIEISDQAVMLASISLIFVSSLYVPVFQEAFYVSTDVTQPWHNSTYILMRLFAVPTFALYIRMEREYLTGIRFVDWILFAILLLLGNWSKPSFLIAFAPMMLFFLICDFIKTHAKSIWQNIKFGSAVLFSLPICFVQSGKLWNESNGNGVVTDFSFSRFKNGSIIPYTICGLAFPIFVTFIYVLKTREKRKILLQTWIMHAIANLEFTILKETGKRQKHGNFGWGRRITGFILYMVCFLKWVQLYRENKIQKSTFVVGLVFFIASVACGIVYFGIILSGQYNYKI